MVNDKVMNPHDPEQMSLLAVSESDADGQADNSPAATEDELNVRQEDRIMWDICNNSSSGALSWATAMCIKSHWGKEAHIEHFFCYLGQVKCYFLFGFIVPWSVKLCVFCPTMCPCLCAQSLFPVAARVTPVSVLRLRVCLYLSLTLLPVCA